MRRSHIQFPKVMPSIRFQFDRMEMTPQASKYHPEGNVYRHTAVVLGHVTWAARHNKGALVMAALFHDIGKPQTTVVHEDGRITAYGHEAVSVEMFDVWQPIIWDEANSFDVEMARYIITNHMKFKKLREMRPSKVEKLREQSDEIMSRYGQIGPGPFEATVEFTNYDNMLDPTYVRIFLHNFTKEGEEMMNQLVERLDRFVDRLERAVSLHNTLVTNANQKSSVGI